MKKVCSCSQPHYPLQFFRIEGIGYIATRGTKPVARAIAEGWDPADPPAEIKKELEDQYNRSHRFDWLHTPTYLDDRETHLRMKEATRR